MRLAADIKPFLQCVINIQNNVLIETKIVYKSMKNDLKYVKKLQINVINTSSRCTKTMILSEKDDFIAI